jgi:hypothetical protein
MTRFGAAGVAAAVVARTFATWPLGAALIKRATGLSYAEQGRAGGAALASAAIMAASVFALLRLAPPCGPALRIAGGGLFGAGLYGLLLLAFSSDLRAAAWPVAALLRRGDLREGVRRLRLAMAAEGVKPALPSG